MTDIFTTELVVLVELFSTSTTTDYYMTTKQRMYNIKNSFWLGNGHDLKQGEAENWESNALKITGVERSKSLGRQVQTWVGILLLINIIW